MSRILPYPVLSLTLLLMWLLLNGSAAPATLLGGAILALAAPLSLSALEADRLRVRNVVALVKLAGVVLYDIVRSNLAVGAIIYGRGRKMRASGFVAVPLDMRNRYGLTLLAIIITCTPGTVWAQYDSARGRMLLHILDLVDPAELAALIKRRYERLLMEIFE